MVPEWKAQLVLYGCSTGIRRMHLGSLLPLLMCCKRNTYKQNLVQLSLVPWFLRIWGRFLLEKFGINQSIVTIRMNVMKHWFPFLYSKMICILLWCLKIGTFNRINEWTIENKGTYLFHNAKYFKIILFVVLKVNEHFFSCLISSQSRHQ